MSVSIASRSESASSQVSHARTASAVGVLLVLLVLAKVVVQHYLFIGLTNGEYLEEHVFHGLARANWDGMGYFSDFGRWSQVKDWSTWRGNPIDMYPFRVSALLPNTWIVNLLGPSEYSLTLFSMLCGLATVLVVFATGKALEGSKAGLYAALALSLFPPHLIYSSRMNTDMPQLLYLALTVLLLVLGLKRRGRFASLSLYAAGVTAGLTYMAKLPLGLLSLFALFLVIFAAASKDVSILRRGMLCSLSLGGFLTIFALENLWYYHLTGQMFLHWHVMHGNQANLETWRDGAKVYELGSVVFWVYRNGLLGLFEYLRVLSGVYVGGIYNVPIFGWYLWAVLASGLYLLLTRKISRLTLLVLGGFVLYYLYLELGCVFPTFEEGKLHLTYYHKNHRFLIPLSIGISLCIGIALAQIHQAMSQRRGFRLFSFGLPVLLLATVSIGTVRPMTSWYFTYRDSYHDLRSAAQFLKSELPPGALVYVEPDLKRQYQTLSGDYPLTIRYLLPSRRVEDLCGGWVVFGGSHGFGVSPHIYPHWMPPLLTTVWRELAPPPASWRLVYQAQRRMHPLKPLLRVFQLPQCLQTRESEIRTK